MYYVRGPNYKPMQLNYYSALPFAPDGFLNPIFFDGNPFVKKLIRPPWPEII
jgi:hypothetical protein